MPQPIQGHGSGPWKHHVGDMQQQVVSDANTVLDPNTDHYIVPALADFTMSLPAPSRSTARPIYISQAGNAGATVTVTVDAPGSFEPAGDFQLLDGESAILFNDGSSRYFKFKIGPA
jgi:hypothetical protein